MSLLQAAKYVWAFPTTYVGLMVGALALVSGGRCQVVDGVLEIAGGAARWLLKHFVPLPGGASAMTLGHVVIAVDRESLDRTRQHERAHVQQCERWGPLFIPVYLLIAVWRWAGGRDPYADHPFEEAARRQADGA